ncbi:MAG: tetratricopeptide repeat protein [Candidatus Omnitrophica bacterium]|nr:tetratricopeptide repeat protein [Candidatus Omnitrophota bacterium]
MIDHQELLEEIKRLRTIGGYPEALILLRQAVESEPTDTKVRFWLAVVLAEIGEHKEAEEHARQVLRLDAGHRDAARLLERIHQWESKAALAATGQK